MTHRPPTREPLVLLSGMNCSPRLWDGVKRRLRIMDPGREILHGIVDCDSIEGCVQNLEQSLPPRFALAGLSLGGIVAMAMLRLAPDRISRVCLMSTNAQAPTPDQVAGWQALRHALTLGHSPRQIQDELLPVLLHPGRRDRELDEQVLAMADDTGANVLDRQLSAQLSRVDERPWLDRVRVPVLVLAAADDAMCPLEKHQELHEIMLTSTLAIVENTGHLSPLEVPEEIAEHLWQWLG